MASPVEKEEEEEEEAAGRRRRLLGAAAGREEGARAVALASCAAAGGRGQGEGEGGGDRGGGRRRGDGRELSDVEDEIWPEEEPSTLDPEATWCLGIGATMTYGGEIRVLFETPSGFAIFRYDGVKLFKTDAIQNVWTDFIREYMAERVNDDIIKTVGLVYDCDLCVNKHAQELRSCGRHLKEVSDVNFEGWSLMKLSTALMMVSQPNGTDYIPADPHKLFGDDYERLVKDPPKYESRLLSTACFRVYEEIFYARSVRGRALIRLESLVEVATHDYMKSKRKNAARR
ncbi:hypothetical protein ACP4OV_028334 [Aristida adscensionis]